MAAIAFALIALGGCGGTPVVVGAAQFTAPGVTTLRVAEMSTVDDATLFLAMKKGYFAREHIRIITVPVDSGPEALANLAAGKADIAFSDYVSAILATSAGQPLRVIVDAYSAAPHLLMVVVPPHSPIKSPTQLAGKTIAVNAINHIVTLLTLSTLKTYGVSPSRVRLTTMAFSQMPNALRDGTVDAAWLTEPFLSEAGQDVGATELLDTATGATANMPMAGFVVAPGFAARDQRLVSAFARAMRQAALDAVDRRQIQNVLPDYMLGVTPQTLAILTVGSYPTTLNRIRIQRVADLMTEFGMLKKRFDITPMVP
jgi:NitT/TauT family transport system substrate-binding protein